MIWLLIVTIAHVPMGAKYETRDECERDALAVLASYPEAKIECVERRKK